MSKEEENSINKKDDFPYDDKTKNQIKMFYKKIASTPGKRDKFLYKHTNEGNLEIYDRKTNDLLSTIPLLYYRPYTKDEYDTIEKERIEEIIKIEEQIDIIRGLLRNAYSEYKETKDSTNFLKYNEEMKDLELKKIYYRSPVRGIKTIESIEKRDIDFEDTFEKRKINNVYISIYRDFPLWKLYGKYTDSKEVIEASVQKHTILLTGESFLNDGKIARVFNEANEDDTNYFLSIFTLEDFVYNNVKYSSPYQAFEATRLETLKYDDLRNQIMKSKSIKYIKAIASKIKKALTNTKEVWDDILTEFYTQNSDYIELLRDTKNTILVFANNPSLPYIGGIGFEAGTEVYDKTKWKTLKIGDVIVGPNIVGNVLMELRTEFNESIPQVESAEVYDSYTTDEEKEKQKTAAIINFRKNH